MQSDNVKENEAGLFLAGLEIEAEIAADLTSEKLMEQIHVIKPWDPWWMKFSPEFVHLERNRNNG